MRSARLSASTMAACTLALVVAFGAGQAAAAEPAVVGAPPSYQTIAYDRTPRAVTLPVGTERFITFPSSVQFGMPPSLTTKLRAQTVDDTIYLRALEPFEATRAAVRGIQDGRIYLLDISAAPGASDATPIRIVATATPLLGADEGSALATVQPPPPTLERAETRPLPDIGYLELTRLAAQQLYAPPRLAAATPGVTAVPLPKIDATTRLIRGGGIEALPIASWRAANGLSVTAVMLRNTLPEAVTWDPRLLRGNWRAAAAMHTRLGPRGTDAETSAMFLIHDGAFIDAARPWLD